PLHELDPLLHLLRKAIEVEAPAGDLQRAPRDVHSDDARELLVPDEGVQETSFATAQVDHPSRTRLLQDRNDCPKPLRVEADLLLERFLLAGLGLLGRLGIGVLIGNESREGLADEPSLALQVPADDELAFRVTREPSLPASQKLLELVVADPVVLVVVQDREQ